MLGGGEFQLVGAAKQFLKGGENPKKYYFSYNLGPLGPK